MAAAPAASRRRLPGTVRQQAACIARCRSAARDEFARLLFSDELRFNLDECNAFAFNAGSVCRDFQRRRTSPGRAEDLNVIERVHGQLAGYARRAVPRSSLLHDVD
jgi:hypothetical protein